LHTKSRVEHSLIQGARISYGANPPNEAALLRFRDAISCIVPSWFPFLQARLHRPGGVLSLPVRHRHRL